jgi:hypothetical protein
MSSYFPIHFIMSLYFYIECLFLHQILNFPCNLKVENRSTVVPLIFILTLCECLRQNPIVLVVRGDIFR